MIDRAAADGNTVYMTKFRTTFIWTSVSERRNVDSRKRFGEILPYITLPGFFGEKLKKIRPS